MFRNDRATAFEHALAPHVRASDELARWLLHDENDAQDAVQEAWLRAFRFFDAASGTRVQAWFLAIVRNTCYAVLARRRARLVDTGDEALDAADEQQGAESLRAETPEAALLRAASGHRLSDALQALPAEFREVFTLRELEGLSYKEIATAAGIPIGTVMSRLSRARQKLQRRLIAEHRVNAH